MPSDATMKTESSKTAGTVRFRDGIGVRLASADAFGEPIEQLQLCTDLAALESAVRERVSRLINFRHVRYVRLRGSERLTNATKDVVVTYDAVPGTRLSEFLELAAHAPLRIDIDTALQIVRELLPAIAVLHDSRNVTHGAIAPERLVLTPQGRLVIVDHGLGLALGKLGYSRKRFWQQLRVPVPQGTGKIVFDARTDVIQIGMVALSLILGRPIEENDFPQNLERLLDGGERDAVDRAVAGVVVRIAGLARSRAAARKARGVRDGARGAAGIREAVQRHALRRELECAEEPGDALRRGGAGQGAGGRRAGRGGVGADWRAAREHPIERGLGSGRRGDSPPPIARPGRSCAAGNGTCGDIAGGRGRPRAEGPRARDAQGAGHADHRFASSREARCAARTDAAPAAVAPDRTSRTSTARRRQERAVDQA